MSYPDSITEYNENDTDPTGQWESKFEHLWEKLVMVAERPDASSLMREFIRSLVDSERKAASAEAIARYFQRIRKYRSRWRNSKIDTEAMLQMRDNGMTLEEIAEHFDVSKQRVHQRLKQVTITNNKPDAA